MIKAVYIHIPFCVKKCNYCDFNSFDNLSHLKKDYVDALLKEINITRVETVFIGGGTPTSLEIDDLLRVINAVSGEEFTVEVNPATAPDTGRTAAGCSTGFDRQPTP